MITGTADLAELAKDVPTIERWASAPVELSEVECFQLVAEMRGAAREAVLPPSLHSTATPSLAIQAWNVGESPWGPFSFVHTRVICRSGARARALTTAATASTSEAATALSTRYGYPCRVGPVALRRSYVGVELDADGLHSFTVDPNPLGLDDVQYTTTMNLAHSPSGLRLVQVDAQYVSQRVERVRNRRLSFDGSRWGSALLDPYHVVSASIAVGTIHLRPVRFVCRPDESAFTGTETVEPPDTDALG